jgi:hypothetical protein
MGASEAAGQQPPADGEEQPDTTVQQGTTDQPATGDDTDSSGAIWSGAKEKPKDQPSTGDDTDSPGAIWSG